MYAVLILARIMHTMIYYAGRPGTEMMLTVLLTTLIEIPASIPLVCLISDGGTDIAAEIGGKKGETAIRLLYSAYFLFIASGTITYYSRFISVEFPNVATVQIVIVVLAAAAAYCARLGIEGIARACGIVYGVIIATVILMAAVSEGRLDPLNLLPITSESIPSMIKYAAADLSSSWWLPMLASLAPYLRGGVKKTVALYLASKLVIIEALVFTLILMLWGLVEIIGYPILALGAYAKTDFIQHFDSINMLVWTLNCVIVNGVYIFIASKAHGDERKSMPIAVCTAAVTAGALLSYYFKADYNSLTAFIIKTGGILLLGIILPLAALIKRKIGRYSLKCRENSSLSC